MANSKFVGVTLPLPIYEYILKEIEEGAYMSPADWIREACRKFYLERRGGGGGPNNL